MERWPTGRFDVMRVGGEELRAFVPNPLPPEPSLEPSGGRRRLLERAILALGRQLSTEKQTTQEQAQDPPNTGAQEPAA